MQAPWQWRQTSATLASPPLQNRPLRLAMLPLPRPTADMRRPCLYTLRALLQVHPSPLLLFMLFYPKHAVLAAPPSVSQSTAARRSASEGKDGCVLAPRALILSNAIPDSHGVAAAPQQKPLCVVKLFDGRAWAENARLSSFTQPKYQRLEEAEKGISSDAPGLTAACLCAGPAEEGEVDLQSFLKKKKKKSHVPAPAPSHEHHKKNATTPAPGPGHHKKNETTPEKQKKAATNTPAAAAVGEVSFIISRLQQ